MLHLKGYIFQLITKLYEHNSTIITTNQPFSKWRDVFSDMTLANAILDDFCIILISLKLLAHHTKQRKY